MPTITKPTGDQLLEEILERAKPSEPELDDELKEEEEPDLSKIRQTAPPKKGPCRRCGEDKPINRLMLCYPCWVKTNLEERGWREGMAHPDWCKCEGVGGHGKSFGN